MEYEIPKPSNKLLVVAELDSDTWVGEVKRIRGKKQPLTSARLHALQFVEVGTPVARRPPSQIPACSIPAPNVVHHIWCVMWATWLCGAEVALPLIYWAFGIPNTT